MSRTRRRLAALALALAVVPISACGSGAPTDTVTGNSGGGGGHAAVAGARKGMKFAQCMRSHGIGDFPDPPASGGLTIDAIANGSAVDTNSPAFTQALSACRALEPAGFTGTTRTPTQQTAALEFARCIRDNGVKDFPDPIVGEPLVDTNRIPSSAQPGGMTILNAAMQKCRGFGAAAGARR